MKSLLRFREMQTKNMKYQFIPLSVVKIKKGDDIKSESHIEQLKLLYFWWAVN